ncbi:MAG: DUF305 domain-containing protein [Nakamurella sp.]
MNPLARPRVLAAAAGLTLTLALSACGGTDSAATSTTSSTSSTASSAGSGTTATSESVAGSSGASDTAHNDADVLFVQQMIPHHEGAVAMAELVPDRASDQGVKDLAAQIKAAQQPEIDQMNGWLAIWNTGGGTGMDMTSGTAAGMDMAPTSGMAMGGMMSDEDMAALTAVTGADFDRLFLTQMIVHHQGAVDMADVEIGSGVNSGALALAESIRTGQTAEIATMQELLARI